MKTLLCILFPPVGVAMKGHGAGQIILNVLLCMFFALPGIIHALVVSDISGTPDNFNFNSNVNSADELEKLHNLKEKGILTEQEFLQKKKRLLE